MSRLSQKHKSKRTKSWPMREKKLRKLLKKLQTLSISSENISKNYLKQMSINLLNAPREIQ